MADRPGRDPGQNVFDLVVGQRRVLRPAQDRQHVRSRLPTFLMPDEGEIDRSPSPGYTGNWLTHVSVTSPGNPSWSSVFRYCCSDTPRSSAADSMTSGNDGFTQLPWHTSQCPFLHSLVSISARVVITSRCSRYTLASKRCSSRARSAGRIDMAWSTWPSSSAAMAAKVLPRLPGPTFPTRA